MTERLLRHRDLTVIEETDRMFLVEGSAESVESLMAEFDGWSLTQERFVPLPDPRHKIKQGGR